MGKKAKQNEAGYDNNGNKVEAKTSVLLCVFVLAVVVLAGILLILLADCYGWFTFLEKPLNAAGQFLKRNWMNISMTFSSTGRGALKPKLLTALQSATRSSACRR